MLELVGEGVVLVVGMMVWITIIGIAITINIVISMSMTIPPTNHLQRLTSHSIEFLLFSIPNPVNRIPLVTFPLSPISCPPLFRINPQLPPEPLLNQRIRPLLDLLSLHLSPPQHHSPGTHSLPLLL